MFLYWFVCCRRPETFVHTITSERLFGFLSFFWQDWWPWPIDYVIRVWSIFDVTLTLKFQGQIWNFLYPSKNGRIAAKRKASISIELYCHKCDHRIWPWLWPCLKLSRSNMEFAISRPNMSNCNQTKSKHIEWTQGLKCEHGAWPWPWT